MPAQPCQPVRQAGVWGPLWGTQITCLPAYLPTRVPGYLANSLLACRYSSQDALQGATLAVPPQQSGRSRGTGSRGQ